MIHPKTALANARFVSAINDELHKQSTRKSLHKHYRYRELHTSQVERARGQRLPIDGRSRLLREEE